jgi:Putative esterase
MNGFLRAIVRVAAVGIALTGCNAAIVAQQQAPSPELSFSLSFPATAHSGPITGRFFLCISKDDKQEPRMNAEEIFGIDVHSLAAGHTVVMESATPGGSSKHLRELPPGDYYVQAVLNIYTEFHRADGHTVWAHMDHWEGQNFATSPGNLISAPQKLHVSADGKQTLTLVADRTIPDVVVPPDTEWVKHIKFRSKILSDFWGQPIYIGAIVLLPKGYSEHPDAKYPAIYLQGHFNLGAPFGFTTEPDKPGSKSWARLREEWAARHIKNMPEPPPGTNYNGTLMNVESGYEFYQAWTSDHFPRMIAVTFQHPTPYFDDSYGINSPSAGPYDDAIMKELIPAVEEHFRIIRQSYARVLSGGSTGGWGALAMQVYHPDFYGGVWSFYPDPVDFHRYYGGVDIYEDDNAFTEKPTRAFVGGGDRNRIESQYLSVLGTQDGGFEWDKYVPVGENGLPKPVWDFATGKIDHAVVASMKENNYDLHDYLERNWATIGSQLVGKLHILIGDEDSGYANLAVYQLENYLEGTNPYYAGSFEYGRPMKFHGWQPTTNAELVKTMAAHIMKYSPDKTQEAWHY